MNSPADALLPRNSLLWLLGAQTLVMTPLFLQLPLWLPALWAVVMCWQLMQFRGRWQRPGRFTRVVLIVLCLVGLRLSFGRFLGMEPMVAMLICAVLLKQLEIERRRDALLLIYLSYFLLATQFLFSQTLLAGLLGLFCFWINSSALLSIHQPQGHQYPLRTLKLSGTMLLHSIPLMLLLFVMMPRIGSLWAVPSLQHSATTGVSDSMAPGDFTRLLRSGGVAFRVSFDGPLPPRNQLYWRGLVFSSFDGRRWESAHPSDYFGENQLVSWEGEAPAQWRSLLQPEGVSIDYSIIMEPSRQSWLYSLGMVKEFSAASSVRLGYARDFRLISSEPVFQRLQYQVASYLDYRLEAESLSHWRRRSELQLPAGFNPVSLRKAQQWRSEVASEEAYIERILAFFRASFRYSFEPPALGQNSVDEFLWQTQEGFCEHFASSFVVMMRAAGIPARVVAGYMGGEYNPAENYMVVHQYDAHAWAEVWLQGRGWVRVDPTAAVAPERISQSLGDSNPGLTEGLISLGRYRHFPLVAELRLRWDAIQYHWGKAVLGFDKESQWRLLNSWMSGASPLKLLLTMLVVGGAVIGLMSLHLWWQARPRKLEGAEKFAQQVERVLAKRGYERQSGESMGQFTRRLAELEPGLESSLRQVRACFDASYYADQDVPGQQFKTALTGLRQSLRTGLNK